MRRVPSSSLRVLVLGFALVWLASGCASTRPSGPQFLDYCGDIACNAETYARWSAALQSEVSIPTRFYDGASAITVGGWLPPVAMGAVDSPGPTGFFARRSLSSETLAFLRGTNVAIFFNVRPVFMSLLAGVEPEGFEGRRGLQLDCLILAREQNVVEGALESLGEDRTRVAEEVSGLLSRRLFAGALPKRMRVALREEFEGVIDFNEKCQRRRFGLSMLRAMRVEDGSWPEAGGEGRELEACSCEVRAR
ncbi:MAG: hypothetical protein AB8G23_07735 [Myxococcota bacterium]